MLLNLTKMRELHPRENEGTTPTKMGNNQQRRNSFMIQVVTCSANLDDAILGDEEAGEDLED